MNKNFAKKLIFNLGFVLIIAYAVFITVVSYHLAQRREALKREISFLSLIREDLEERLKKVSIQIQDLEVQNINLQEMVKGINTQTVSSRKEIEETINTYKSKIESLEKDLESAKQNYIMVKEENAQLKNSEGLMQKKDEAIVLLQKNLLERERSIQELSVNLARLKEELKNKEATLHYNLAVNFTKSKNFDNAIIEYENALKIDPEHAASHYNLGILYEDYKKDLAQAVYHYRKYLSLKPGAEEGKEVRRWILELEAKILGTPTW